ncbi:MAG: DUF1566 domain-containing protein [Bacteroidota bacterium]
MRISILRDVTPVYIEIQSVSTNANGLATVEIGTAITPELGIFANIDWSYGTYFIKTETDPTGGTNYGTIVTTSQLLSVPYALHAKVSDSIAGGITETDPVYSNSQAKNITASDITNLSNLSGTNTGDQDLSTFATITDLSNKVDKETGKGLTSNDYTTAEKNKLSGIAEGAEVNVNADWNATSGDSLILNKPTLATVASTGNYSDLINKPVGTNIGDVQYWNGTNWAVLPIGEAEQVLTVSSSNIPVWTAILPTLTTTIASYVTSTTATSGGTITKNGGSAITTSGVCWSTEPNPTINKNKTTETATSGAFVSAITNLSLGKKYYVRAYATNSVGTAYGNEISFVAVAIGDAYQGGLVAYILQPNDPSYVAGETHGLVVASADQSAGIRWYNGSNVSTGATSVAFGDGMANTNKIISVQGATITSYAAGLARSYTGGGYTDWYLPSYNEIQKLYAMKQLGFGGFANSYYWTSSETYSNCAWGYWVFSGGYSNTVNKADSWNVRAVRVF